MSSASAVRGPAPRREEARLARMWDVARLSGHPNLTLTLAPQHTQHSPNSDPDSQCATVFPYRAEIEGAADQVSELCAYAYVA